MGNESSNLITQIDFARAGQITPAMRVVAEKEGRSPEFIREGVAAGRIAIPANIHHTSLSPEGVGEGDYLKIDIAYDKEATEKAEQEALDLLKDD